MLFKTRLNSFNFKNFLSHGKSCLSLLKINFTQNFATAAESRSVISKYRNIIIPSAVIPASPSGRGGTKCRRGQQ